ncbi:MAG: endolytic transglycosylase MltG [Chloroflexota bacterium]|nr:endolytic transglycosylase MltG [Chloroflexota bacterium]
MSRRWKQISVIASVMILAILIVFVTQLIIVRSLDSGQEGEAQSVYFVIDRDESVDSIADRLYDSNLIRSPGYFRLRVRISGDGDDIVAGRYRLDTAMSTSQIINLITSEDAALAQEAQVQFIEGWRTEQYAEALVEANVVSTVDAFMAATRDPKWNDEFSFLHTRPSGVALEGYLFPDTYNFRVDSEPDDVIEKILETFRERVTPGMIADADARGLTFHQVMTVASIIEREAAIDEERAVIASVYYNRIAAGMPLQADPTVQYQIGTRDDWWPELVPEDLQQNGRYNTYLNPDLPPGPICNPSLASIEAALHPAQTAFLFFVARGDGSHAFATTAEEHQLNVEQYQRGS